MKVYLDEGARTPTKAHPKDAGYDLYSIESAVIPGRGSYTFDTGVHMEIPKGYCGLLVSKSGLNVVRDLTSTGLIDEGYTGSIRVKLYNHGKAPAQIAAGQKISQIVILPVVDTTLELVNDLGSFMASERGANGFGSSGQ